MSDVSRRGRLAAAGAVGVGVAMTGGAAALGGGSADDLVRAAKSARLVDLSFLTPLKIQGASGSPLRAIALAP